MESELRTAALGQRGTDAPIEAWLFAQALLGKPIPDPTASARRSSDERERLQWLAQISTRHEQQLRRLESTESEARNRREQLEWLSTFSTDHERQLRRLQTPKSEAREAQQLFERFADRSNVQEANWDASKHPRGGFSQNRGWWSPAGGSGSAGSADKFVPTSTGGERKVVDQHNAPPAMLELASAWHETNRVLDQCRRDLDTLPARIASERAQLAFGGRAAPVHAQNLAQAQRDLTQAQELAPQLEKQLRELQQDYSDSGYDSIDYASWTPGETRVGGRGIEQVGRAVAASASPAGLSPTDDEVTIAAVAISTLQLGRAALRKALARSPASTSSEAAALKPYLGTGGGHHVPAKKAFEGAPGYDVKAALAIPREELTRLRLDHFIVTGAQKRLYQEFAKSGQQLTWNAVEKIETEALVRAGLNSDMARATVKQGIQALKESGIAGPTRIPWGK